MKELLNIIEESDFGLHLTDIDDMSDVRVNSLNINKSKKKNVVPIFPRLEHSHLLYFSNSFVVQIIGPLLPSVNFQIFKEKLFKM